MKKKIVFIILLLSYIGIIITVFYTKIVKTEVDIPVVPIAYCEKIDYRVINNNDNLVIQYLKQEEVICEKVLNKRS